MTEEEKIINTLEKLSKSTFRNKFILKNKDILYIDEKGMDKIREHTYDFINERLVPEVIANDGKQTPTKGHPCFIAQHATACCCRGCLSKWHHIPEGKKLSDKEKDYVVNVIMTYIKNQYDNFDRDLLAKDNKKVVRKKATKEENTFEQIKLEL